MGGLTAQPRDIGPWGGVSWPTPQVLRSVMGLQPCWGAGGTIQGYLWWEEVRPGPPIHALLRAVSK